MKTVRPGDNLDRAVDDSRPQAVGAVQREKLIPRKQIPAL